MTTRFLSALGYLALGFWCLAFQASAAESTQPSAPTRKFTIDRLYSLPWLIGTRPDDPVWSPDSRRIAFLWNDQGTNFLDVWMTDLATAKPVRVTTMPEPEDPSNPGVDIGKLEQVERAETDRGVSSVIWAPDGRHLIFNLHGRLFQVLPGQPPQALTAADASVSDATASSQAHAIAYLSSGDLWVMDLADARHSVRKVFSSARADVQVESFTWSHNGKRLALVEADGTRVPERGIPDYLAPETRLVEVKRAIPGEPSEARRLGVIAVTGGAVQWADLGKDPLDQIFSVSWSPDDKHLLVDKSDLYIKDRRLLLVDADDGHSRDLLREVNPLNVTAEWWAGWAPDGRGVYFTSDRDNYYQIYYEALSGGQPKAITTGDHAVSSAAISPAADSLFVVTNEGRPELRRAFRVPLDGGAPQLVTPAAGSHQPVPSPDGKYLADLFSNDVTPPDLYVQRVAASREVEPMARQITHSPLPEFKDYQWIAAKYVVFNNVNDGTPLHARLTLPPNFDPDRKYPAILGSVYSNTVHNEWGGRVYHPTWAIDQFLAQQGYVIMNVDIGGSSGYGKLFRQRIREDYGGVDVDDLYSGVRYLVAQGYVDPKRVGIWGSSYGGLLAAMSMFRYPGVYQAGVAAAPATSLFHATTGEMQTMMAPQDHQSQYRNASAFLHSGGLQGHLMIIHGMRDTTVLFKDSVTLVQRLILQGKDVDFVPLPNAHHLWDTEGLAQARYAYHKLYDFLERYLGASNAGGK
ncbi:MAG: prolyl oligopeptidase family serine peptidase [Rhodanobacteraceae bacterium]